MTSGVFLCGCTPEEKAHYQTERRDPHGNLLCPEHGQPMYGYLTPTVDHPGLGRMLDYKRMGTGSTVRVSSEGVIDRRDNRDPEQVYVEMHAGWNGHG